MFGPQSSYMGNLDLLYKLLCTGQGVALVPQDDMIPSGMPAHSGISSSFRRFAFPWSPAIKKEMGAPLVLGFQP